MTESFWQQSISEKFWREATYQPDPEPRHDSGPDDSPEHELTMSEFRAARAALIPEGDGLTLNVAGQSSARESLPGYLTKEGLAARTSAQYSQDDAKSTLERRKPGMVKDDASERNRLSGYYSEMRGLSGGVQ